MVKNFNRLRVSVAPSSADQVMAKRKAVFATMARMILYRSTDTYFFGVGQFWRIDF